MKEYTLYDYRRALNLYIHSHEFLENCLDYPSLNSFNDGMYIGFRICLDVLDEFIRENEEIIRRNKNEFSKN